MVGSSKNLQLLKEQFLKEDTIKTFFLYSIPLLLFSYYRLNIPHTSSSVPVLKEQKYRNISKFHNILTLPAITSFL